MKTILYILAFLFTTNAYSQFIKNDINKFFETKNVKYVLRHCDTEVEFFINDKYYNKEDLDPRFKDIFSCADVKYKFDYKYKEDGIKYYQWIISLTSVRDYCVYEFSFKTLDDKIFWISIDNVYDLKNTVR